MMHLLAPNIFRSIVWWLSISLVHSGVFWLVQMVFYIEACESGSMFDGLLPANISGQ